MKKLLIVILPVILILSFCISAMAADEPFKPGVTYTPTLTAAERAAIHAQVDALAGDVGDAMVGDGTYDPLTLVGALMDGSSYNSISRGGTASTAYPFPVSNTSSNQNEYDRKVAKLTWLVKLAEDLGFPVVVRRQPDKVVYVEIGDPDAPEMVMALSHLDSPPASAGNLTRWRGADGLFGTASKYYSTIYHTPYVKDGWLYGAGVQDDSGPTLATLLAAKAMMEAGVPMDRRVRIVMGCYEDGGPGTPSVANTGNYISIPYYTSNPGFYDNWCYKYLNREETPIAGYTSDSRFPVIVGNSGSATPSVQMSLAADSAKPFRLTAATAGLTLRQGDDTLRYIVYGSTTQIASRAVFTLNVAGVSTADRNSFIASIVAAATKQGWLPALPLTTPKVQTAISGDNLTLEINTDVAMEMPTPQYGKNAIVWGMYLLGEALGEKGITAADMQLKRAADGISGLFFAGGEEGEAYIGKYMGIPENLLRNPQNGCPNFTFALMGGINSETLTSFYTASSGALSIPMQVRSMHINTTNAAAAAAPVVSAFQAKGFTLSASIASAVGSGLYLSHDNLLTALQLASYKATMKHDPVAFNDVYGLLDISYAQGTTGGTLAGNFQNKMTAFGAIIPGNERWWHTANERITVKSIIQMTKLMADGMQEMARYSGPAGAQYMWADMPGLNSDRADLDLLDVTIATYKDASSAVLPQHLGQSALLAATAFDIPMWSARGNSSPTATAFAAGHGTGGVYLPTNNADFLANTFVLPMRLEFKVPRPSGLTNAGWDAFVNGGFEHFTFNILQGGNVIPLKVPVGESADKFFSKRVSQYDPNTLYLAVNLAIKDAPYAGVETVIADSKTDLYSLNPNYLASNPNPFPERGAKEQRGFFLFGDGSKNARFASPEAVYAAVTPFSVSFVNYDGATLDTQLVTFGDTAAAPPDPVREGYRFDGWFTEAVGGAKWDFATKITADMQLYTHWTEYNYTVYLKSDKTDILSSDTLTVDVMLVGNLNYSQLATEIAFDASLLEFDGYADLKGWAASVSKTSTNIIAVRSVPGMNMVVGAPCSSDTCIVTLKFKIKEGFAEDSIDTELSFASVLVSPTGGVVGTVIAPGKSLSITINKE
jgi:uncharacterized repeat protein (TIGR02543 family)